MWKIIMPQHCATTTSWSFSTRKKSCSMILLLVLVIILLNSCAVVVSGLEGLEPPDIISPADPTIVIQAGSNIVVICHGDAPIQWSVPRPVDGRFSFQDSKMPNGSNSSGSPRPYASTLTLSSVTVLDVGIYECHYNSSNEGDSIYVYVDDESSPIVGLHSEVYSILTAHPGMTLTIPCKPSSPNVTIEMKFNSVQDIPLTRDNYNPYFGFLIDPVQTSSDGLYTCVGKRKGEEQRKLWLVTVTPAPVNATSIILRTPKISSVDGGVVQLGGNFSIECTTVEESFVYYNINWTEPYRVINSGRATVTLEPIKEPSSPTSSARKAFKVTLTVINAQKEDAGNYVCSVWTMHSTKTADKYINVYGSEERFLNVSTEKTDITEHGGRDATWVINISSYPTAIDYVWRNKNGDEIGRDATNPKYQTERKGSIVVLRILNASLKDGGSYQFLVRLRDFRDIFKILDLNLTVLDKPEVSIRGKDGGEVYFNQNKTYSLTCTARGNPLPKLSWWFKEMPVSTFDGMMSDRTTTRSPGLGLIFGSFDCGSKAGMERIQPDNTSTSPTPNGISRIFTSTTISFRPSKHGVLFCEGVNDEGEGCSQRPVKVIDFPSENNKGYGIMVPKEFISQDYVHLSCALSKLNGGREISWKKKISSGDTLADVKIDNSSVMLSSYETKWSWQKILTFPKISKDHDGEYVCILKPSSSSSREEVWNDTVVVAVKDMIPPTITHTNLNQTEVTFKEGEPPELKLFCVANGLPAPVIEWTKDGLPPSQWPDDIKYNISENGESLTFSYIRSIASGKYSCTATNRNGTAFKFLDIEVEGTGIHPVLIAFIVCCVIVILILIFCIIKNSHNKAKMKRYLIEIQKQEFEQGAIENINPELGIEDQANLLPYDNKWEFPRNRLRLGMQLGSGAFGRVMKAEAIGIISEEPVTTVAVKMVKANADESHIKALMSELKIMVHLGRHVNVVNLLGAVTTNLVKKKELFVIVEFCKYGSLLNYMHRHRHTFINQLDPIRGAIDSSIYRQLSRSSAQSSEAPRLNYASLTFTDTGNSRTAPNGYRTLEEIPCSTSPTTSCPGGFDGSSSIVGNGRQSADYQMESMCTDMSYISSSPNTATANGPGPGPGGHCGHRDHRRSSCASSGWGDKDGNGHYRGDYQHVEVRPIRSVDLLGWAFQMARGMEYLASRKVLHGDLAARNALLTEGNVVKICDFGLAKEMYKDYKYKKKSEGVLLPVKWMAIESIYYGVFSTQSDVWSFGVVLWELFTLGKTPYPGMEADDRFYKMLNEGYRMEKPPLAPSSIYDLMTECWAHDSTSRPTFSTLVDRIGDLMEEGHRQQYVDLNVPYDRMNRELFANGKEDYLSKMSGPDFISASARPTPERGYENVATKEEAGYLVPNANGNISVNLLSPGAAGQATQYQNIVHNNNPSQNSNQDSEPSGQFLANNAGYVFMNRGGSGDFDHGVSPTSPSSNAATTAPYVKFDIEPDPPSRLGPASATNISYVTLGLGDRISENQASDEENNARNPSPPAPPQLATGISNQNYVSSSTVPSSSSSPQQPLEQVVEEGGSGNNSSGQKTENNAKHHNGNSRRHLNRRQKNDSGLGSIDSNHFDASAKEGDEEENYGDEKYRGDLPSQHNLSYVSHFTSPPSPPSSPPPSSYGTSNGKMNGGVQSTGGPPTHQNLNGVIV